MDSDYKEDAFFKAVRSCFASDEAFAEAIIGSLKAKTASEVIVNNKNRSKAGYIYFLHDGELCKIGRTKNKPESRAKALKVGNVNIKLIGSIKTDNAELLEATLHEKFGDKRVDGEWFRLSAKEIRNITKTP